MSYNIYEIEGKQEFVCFSQSLIFHCSMKVSRIKMGYLVTARKNGYDQCHIFLRKRDQNI